MMNFFFPKNDPQTDSEIVIFVLKSSFVAAVGVTAFMTSVGFFLNWVLS